MNPAHIQLVRNAIPLWYANMAWAKELLVRTFGLTEAQDILREKRRGVHQIPGTCWFLRTHGIGVDIYKSPDVGGIDFDFDKPDPDAWRLGIFMLKQVNDGQLPYEMYRDLIEDDDLLKQVIGEVLSGTA